MQGEVLYNDSELQNESKLILCISNTTEGNIDDTVLFIGWDSDNKDYFVKGSKQKDDSVPFAFHCDSSHDLYDFIELLLNKKGVITLSYYNYNNIYSLDKDSELTYEFFESNMDSNYELFNISFTRFDRMKMVNSLRMLKNIYNWGVYKKI